MQNPQDMGFFEGLWNMKLKQSGLLDAYEKQQGRDRALELVGTKQTPYEDPAQMFDATSSLPEGLMTKGTGLVGKELTPQEFYGGLMGVSGYQNIGAQGLANISAQRGLMDRQTSKLASESGKSGFKREKELRSAFEGQAKDFVKVRDANRRIGAAAENPTAAGDMALIFNFMKVLDPGSTVREGEFATAQNATGVPSRITNLYNNIMSGQRLNPNQRLDFVSQANNLYSAQLGGLEQLESQYTGLAKNYGLNPKNIIVDYRVKPKDKKMSAKDKEAMEWAKANPSDPRSALILKKLGGKNGL